MKRLRRTLLIIASFPVSAIFNFFAAITMLTARKYERNKDLKK